MATLPAARSRVSRRKAPTLRGRLMTLGLVLLLLLALALGGVFFQLRRTPTFYAAEIAQPAENRRAASDVCLAKASAVASEAQRPGGWYAEFTAEELNGWLAHDLPTNHPELLEGGVDAPRVALEEHRGTLAFQYQGAVNTVVSLEFDAEVRDGQTLALRFSGLRAGAMALPLGLLVEQITVAARNLDHPVQWIEEDGCPVALISIADAKSGGHEIALSDVRIEQGRVILQGETTSIGAAN